MLGLILCALIIACQTAKSQKLNQKNNQASQETHPDQPGGIDMTQANKGNNPAPNATERKILVAYFSHSGNTQIVANQIHERAGGDIFRIITVKKYPADYNQVVEMAKQEFADKAVPQLSTQIPDLDRYQVVFIGYPIWWGTIPRAVTAFLSQYSFTGKTIIPFCTHEGSGLGISEKDITKLCPNSTILEGLAIRGSNAKTAQKDVAAWLKRLKITE